MKKNPKKNLNFFQKLNVLEWATVHNVPVKGL